jgi:hypothetical protein
VVRSIYIYILNLPLLIFHRLILPCLSMCMLAPRRQVADRLDVNMMHLYL